MNENLSELIFILDKSGSMAGLEKETIGGFNSMISKQKKLDGEAIITTILFDDTIEVIHDRIELSNIKRMTSKDYIVSGCTALFDAIGFAVSKTLVAQANLKKSEMPTS